MNKLKLTSTEQIVLKLIQDDMKFIYNVIQNMEKRDAYNFTIALLPYMALVSKEAHKWCGKIKDLKDYIPSTPNEIEIYYEYYREYNKLLNDDLLIINNKYKNKFNIAKNHFYTLKIFSTTASNDADNYNIYGVGTYQDNIITKQPIYNTIYFSVLIPDFSWENFEKINKDIYTISYHIGKLFGFFIKPNKAKFNNNNNIKSIEYDDYDFGIMSSPFHDEYSDDFLIFDLLCKCNFVLYGINCFTNTLSTTKLRFTYNLYYYICENIDKINNYYSTNFVINSKHKDHELRSAFMHYGIWKIVKNKVNPLDAFGGITNIRLSISWKNLLIFVSNEINSFSKQLDNYLKNNKISHNYCISNKA